MKTNERGNIGAGCAVLLMGLLLGFACAALVLGPQWLDGMIIAMKAGW